MAPYNQQVFLNVPFDSQYKKLFDALVFAVHDCGLVARCALEEDDSGQVRVNKLYGIISASKFGIHDLSRTTLDSKFRLPRFNMPLELGLFLGARQFGSSAQRRKSCLILDRERFRYQVFCSDIAGQDIRAHANDVGQVLTAVRNWLRTNLSGSKQLPGPARLIGRYIEFRQHLPMMCQEEKLRVSELTFVEYRNSVVAWKKINPIDK